MPAGGAAGAGRLSVFFFSAGASARAGAAASASGADSSETLASLGFGQAVALGALCNALVCLAVWLTYSGRTVADKILAVVPPIAAFVAAGFEHSVANMYFIPFALFVKNSDEALASAGETVDTSGLTWEAFFLDNLLPVTLGNVVGGTLMVAAVYWFVYLRDPDGPGS